jgi:hypothetical protein
MRLAVRSGDEDRRPEVVQSLRHFLQAESLSALGNPLPARDECVNACNSRRKYDRRMRGSVDSFSTVMWPRHSRRIDPTSLSA